MKDILIKEYAVYLGDDVFEKLAETLIEREYSKIFVLMDQNTERFCWPILKSYLVDFVPIVIESGEQQKSIRTSEFVWESLQKNYCDRKAVLLNLGGGVISDLGGFVASTYKRGIDFINIPTTLLSMVDASVGGKLGIDIHSFKNVVGLFNHPKQIFIYPPFIQTLEPAERRNGLAELSKHGLIADIDLWDKLQRYGDTDQAKINALIFQSLKIKVAIVKKDPHEKGLRKSLNFGHTIGHAIETYSLKHDQYPLRHGEAVAIGMICESFLSHKVTGLSAKDLKEITQYYLNHFPRYKQALDFPELLEYMRNDKKNREGKINFTLLKKIGKSKVDIYCPDELVQESIAYYFSFT